MENKIDWKKKLTSRKFWAAVCNFVGMLVMAFGASAGTAEKITALIMAGATVIAYIIAEGLVDAANVRMIDIPGTIEIPVEEVPPDIEK